MAIYTRYGMAVKLTDAKIIPMWSETRRGEIRQHYNKPKQTKRTIEIEEMPTWHVLASYEDGRKLSDGKWIPLGNFNADDGIRELHATVHALCPAWEDKWNEWVPMYGPSQTEVWGDNMGVQVA